MCANSFEQTALLKKKKIFISKAWAGGMAQRIKALTSRSGELSSIPGTPSGKRELTPQGYPLTITLKLCMSKLTHNSDKFNGKILV